MKTSKNTYTNQLAAVMNAADKKKLPAQISALAASLVRGKDLK